MESGLRKNQVIQELTRSTHGDLKQYIPVGTRAAKEDPEFLAHLIAWNQVNGQVRDSKVGLPAVNLTVPLENDYRENALAHLALLPPRDLVRGLKFWHTLPHQGQGRAVIGLVKSYLRAREQKWPWWERTAVQHRAPLKELYATFRVKPNSMADQILFKGQYPKGTIFAEIASLKTMSPSEAAGTIVRKRIPFLIAIGALGEKAKDPVLVQALIEQMTPTELVTNTKALEKLGVKTVPALRAAYEEALGKAATSKKATLKTTRAAEAMTDEKLKAKLQGLQERQLDSLKGIEGDWAVLGDKSGSMEQSIDLAKQVAATLARMVKGEVHLVFFDTSPRYFNVTGKTYDDILKATRTVSASGGTSIGVGLHYLLEKGVGLDGIAIVSDSAENSSPPFVPVYLDLCKRLEKQIPVYLYKTNGERTDALERAMDQATLGLERFDLRVGVDYYSLPNLVQTMRTNRYSLVDSILETPLRTVASVLKSNTEEAA